MLEYLSFKKGVVYRTRTVYTLCMYNSDNVSVADNQQERLVSRISNEIGCFLSGFALGEASFMIICRPRKDYRSGWKISAAFNVSQHDVIPLELFQEKLQCGTLRKAGNDGWYYEVNKLSDIQTIVIPFFDRFPLLGKKAQDFQCFKKAVNLMVNRTENSHVAILDLREKMNNGGKRKYSRVRILRDYTPNPHLR